ncbi:MAG TPA: S41 family peptidase, partial [Bacteroidales bacterium]|nr:S41 family peptidase [Bacteroidales bacterium]
GKYLFFVSSRDFNPTFSEVGPTISYSDMGGIYFVTLSKKTPSLFKLKSDEVEIAKPDTKSVSTDKKKESKKAGKEEPKTESSSDIEIDTDGIVGRIGKLPLKASNYGNLTSVGSRLYYQRMGETDRRPVLAMYDFDSREEKDLGQANGYEISRDKKKMIVSQNGHYAIINLPFAELRLTDNLDLSGLQLDLNKHKEWNQIYWESWRQMRDFFYSPTMNGVDWKAEGDKYHQLVPYVNQRKDLTYIIGELIGELNIGHAYVGGGEQPQPKRIKTGLLGAQLSKDKESGYFKIDRILQGQDWTGDVKSPLTSIGVNAKEGDYILAVDGVPTNNVENIYEMLVDKAGKQVRLTISSTPTKQGEHVETVMPIDDEAPLYYHDWVSSNIEKVNKATNGKVGYIHIPDMGVDGLNDFIKYYYPQLEKEALIIDVRGNGGGFVSPIIIEALRRVASQITITRNSKPEVDPDGTLYGPMVLLCDEFSASDGDIVTYRFKHYNLGKVIGKRTWGGVTGIRGTLPFQDGGFLNRPEFSRYSLDGKKWIIEGKGVEPDIVVDNDPYLEYTGVDQQLNKGIEVLLEELKTQRKTIPNHPPYPVK